MLNVGILEATKKDVSKEKKENQGIEEVNLGYNEKILTDSVSEVRRHHMHL